MLRSKTNPTIFLRLRQPEAAPRALAWEEFYSRYAPIISAFARRLQARPQDAEDVVQDVMIGFFAKAPSFVYDPAKGRFRSYVKVCTYRALRKRLGKAARVNGRPLDDQDPSSLAIDQVWEDVWEQQQLRWALEELRRSAGHTKAFHAFELYVVFSRPAQEVAATLDMHVNSVYRAKEQITQLLREQLRLHDDQ